MHKKYAMQHKLYYSIFFINSKIIFLVLNSFDRLMLVFTTLFFAEQ